MRRAARAIPLLSALVVAGYGPSIAAEHEWPQHKGNSGYTGVSSDASVKPPLRLCWSYRLDGDASGDTGGGVIVAGGRVYVNVANTRSIVALDAATGAFLWESTDADIGFRTVPTYFEERLFLWERKPKSTALVAVNAADGKEIWRTPLETAGRYESRGTVPIYEGRLYCSEGGEDPSVSAYDSTRGERLWKTPVGGEDGPCIVSPTVAEGRVFVGVRETFERTPSRRGATIALDARTGEILWRNRDVFPYWQIAADGQVVSVGMHFSGQERHHLLEAASGKPLWTAPRCGHYSPNSLTGDTVLVKPWGATLYAFDRQTGRELWQFRTPHAGSGCCTPVVAGNFAFMGTGVDHRSGDHESLRAFRQADAPREQGLNGSLHAIDLTTGESAWFFGTSNTVCGEPAIAYGRLYFTSRDGNVYCFVPAKAGEPTTPDTRDASEAASKAASKTASEAASAEAVAGLLSAAAETHAPGTAWPTEGGTAHRAGRPGIRVVPPLELAWKAGTGGRIVAAPAILGNRVFVGSESGRISCFDLHTGRPHWSFDTGAPVRCSPTVTVAALYGGSDSGVLAALDPRTGKRLWTYACGGPVRTSPAVVGDVVVFGANDHHVYALHRHTGKKLWSFRARHHALRAAPVVAGDTVYVAQWADYAWALDLATGAPRWKSFVPVSIEAMSFHRDSLLVRSPYLVIELDPKTGERRRIAPTSYGYGGLAFLGQYLYQSGVRGQYGTRGATRVDLDDPGELAVPRGLGGSLDPERPLVELAGVRYLKPAPLKGDADLLSHATPLALGDKLCFATLKGELILTGPDGAPLWRTRLGGTCHSAPVAVDGTIVVGCDDGHVYVFREANLVGGEPPIPLKGDKR